MFVCWMSQLRPCLVEGYQRWGRILYVWVSTTWDIVVYIQNTWQNSSVYPLSLSLSPSPGVSAGAILVFDVPSKGSNITLSEILEEHNESITDMAAECSGSQVCHVCASSVCAFVFFFVLTALYNTSRNCNHCITYIIPSLCRCLPPLRSA